MADGETAAPETSGGLKGPETLGDPTLIEAEELLRRIVEQEKNQTNPANNIMLKAVESSLTKVNDKIAKEQAKTPPNYKDLERMSKIQTGLMEQKAAIIAGADKTADKKTTRVIEDLTSASDESTARLEEMKKLQEQKASLEAQLGAEPLKSSDKPEDAAKRTEIFGTLSEVTARLEKLEQKGTYEEQEKIRDAQIAKRKEAEAMRAEEDGEAAEKIITDLEESEGESSAGEPDAEKEPEEDKGKDKSTSSEGEEEKAARKRELLHNALHKVAYGLAVDLEKNYPGADGNAYEKMEWNGKAFLLKIVVMFGGTPKWAELVKDNPTLSEFLEKKVGMTFTQEDVKKEGVATGEKRWAVKWEKPVEGWEPGIVEMADVFETAYGDKDEAGKAMGEIKETTTLKEMKDKLPSPAVEEKDKQTERLIKAMEDADATGETKVQEFLTKNAGKVQEKLKPSPTTTEPGKKEQAETKTDPLDELSDVFSDLSHEKIIAYIEEHDLHEGSKVHEMTGLFHLEGAKATEIRDLMFDPNLSPEASAEKMTGYIKTERALSLYSEYMGVIKDLFLDLDLQDPSLPPELEAEAKAELEEGSLGEATGKELQAAMVVFFTGFKTLLNKPIKEFLETGLKVTTNEKAKAEMTAELEALKANNPEAGASEPAPKT